MIPDKIRVNVFMNMHLCVFLFDYMSMLKNILCVESVRSNGKE